MNKKQGMDKYLEAIYILHTEGQNVIGSKLADYLGVARPTVSQTVQRLIALGYVADTDTREIILSDAGVQRAETIIRRHRLLERWLTDVLGFDWAEAHEEASRLESALSERVEKRLAQALGNPTTCPHGNVIPGSGGFVANATPLSQMPIPATVKINRIFEHAEEDMDILRFLEGNGFVPGAEIGLISSSPSEHTITAFINGASVLIPIELAERILAVEVDRK
ncbi:metal-dependent transcriptional regulator [Aneurinibacillus terranovensis]|uniref:metal-dependent transcriptional regulator n=1 Tax=Aneurinibacillus terranovensis TaxID=278991 RepID=UPI0003FEA387|nr:metal-dependent transcriptional regulator [Aneurinibacillus terranovensis]